MSRSRREGATPSVNVQISAPFSGQFVNGSGNIVQGGSQQLRAGNELEQVRLAFAEVRAILRAEPPSADIGTAELRLRELEEVSLSPHPDLDTVARVQHWFGRHLPKVAGTVTSLLIHPLLGHLAEDASETAVDELRRRFGTDAVDGR